MTNSTNRVFKFLGSAWKVNFQNKATGQQDAMISAVVGSNNNPITLWVEYPDGSSHKLTNFVIRRNAKKSAEKQPDYYIQYEMQADAVSPVKKAQVSSEAVEF